MSILPGIVFSKARWTLIRQRNDPMDREIYLDNDHLVDYRLQERTTGLLTTGAQLSASLSYNPTGSAISGSFLGGPTASVAVVTTQSVIAERISSSITESILFDISQSHDSNLSGSNSSSLNLQILLTETPNLSGQYIGTFPGADITTILSSSFSESFTTTFSGSAVTFSITPTVSASVTLSLAVTMSVSGFTSSFTQSTVIPLSDKANRDAGIFEIISSGSFLKTSTPMTLRTVRFIP